MRLKEWIFGPEYDDIRRPSNKWREQVPEGIPGVSRQMTAAELQTALMADPNNVPLYIEAVHYLFDRQDELTNLPPIGYVQNVYANADPSRPDERLSDEDRALYGAVYAIGQRLSIEQEPSA